MSVSQLYEPVGHGRRLGGGSQSLQHAGHIEALVEAISEPRRIARQVPLSNGAVGAVHRIPNIVPHGVHPAQLAAAMSSHRPVYAQRPMRAPTPLDCPKALQRVGAHTAAAREPHLAPARDVVQPKSFRAVQADALRAPLLIGLHRRQKRALASGAPPALAAPPLPASRDIIELHCAHELALDHRLREVGLQQLGAVLGNPQLVRQRQRANPVIGRSDQVHCQKADRQRQLRAGEHAASTHRRLLLTGIALNQLPAVEHAVAWVPTAGALETSRPAPGKQRRLALGLRTALRHKIGQTDASLKLHLVLRHRLSLSRIKPCQYHHPTDSLAESHW